MLFKNRQEAGKKLFLSLKKYENQPDTIVLGLPRGGVVTAYEVAVGLGLPLDVICPRKVGAPYNPEFALGAVDENGEGYFNWDFIERLGVSEEYLNQEIDNEKRQAQRRSNLFRQNRLPLDIEDKTVILVDDGIATGATMKAAIKSVRSKGAIRVIVAVPVGPEDTLNDLKLEADEVLCLETPIVFNAVGQFYSDFNQTEDDEVVALLKHRG